MKRKIFLSQLLVVFLLIISGCQSPNYTPKNNGEKITINDIPKYQGQAYVVINNNEPFFSEDEITDKSFEKYSKLDHLGRCGSAIASVGKDLMPTKERENISSVKPTGWQLVKYDCVDGSYLYNRCHLIAHQLTAENANERNLITGTRSMNIKGMLPFEEKVGNYVRRTNNHVMYRVTPIYEGNNLLATGVLMEGLSVEDKGKAIKFNVFAYNQEPGVKINLKNGDNQPITCTKLPTHGRSYQKNTKYQSSSNYKQTKSESNNGVVRGNRRSKIYHMPGQRAYDQMKDSPNLVTFPNEEEAKKAGYRKAQN